MSFLFLFFSVWAQDMVPSGSPTASNNCAQNGMCTPRVSASELEKSADKLIMGGQSGGEEKRQELERVTQQNCQDNPDPSNPCESVKQADQQRRQEAANSQPKQSPPKEKPPTNKEDQAAQQEDNDPRQSAQGLPVNSLAASSPPGSCDYSNSSPLRNSYDRERKKCEQSHSAANQKCDANRNREIRAALSEAKNAADQVSNSSGKSMLVACDRFGSAAKDLEEALKNYRQTCLPVKAKCENDCFSNIKSGSSLSKLVGGSYGCYQQGRAMISDISKNSQRAKRLMLNCKAFEKPLSQAANDAKALIESIQNSGRCEKLAVEKCKLDPRSGGCVKSRLGDGAPMLTTSTVGSGSMGSSSRSSTTTTGTAGDEAIAAQFDKTQGDGRYSGSIGAAGVASGPTGSKAKIGDSRGSRYAGTANSQTQSPNSQKGRSYGHSRRGGYRLAGSGGRFPSKARNFGPAGYAQGTRDTKSGEEKRKRSKELEQFLPGGKLDPNARNGELHPDGITSANGPTIFEKVGRRYQLYYHRLNIDKISQ